MFLVLLIKLSVTFLDPPYPAFAVGFGIIMLIYQFGWISGAHFNPTVSFALISRGDVPTFPSNDYGQIVMYLVSQFTGGMFGGWMGYFIGGKQTCYTHVPKIGTSINTIMNVFLAEYVFTFLLTFVALHVGTHQQGNQFYGIAVGIAVFIGILAVNDVSGCIINPSVWVGLNIPSWSCIDSDDVDEIQLEFIWLYFLSEMMASVTSGLLFRLVYVPVIKELKRQEEFEEVMSQRMSNVGSYVTPAANLTNENNKNVNISIQNQL